MFKALIETIAKLIRSLAFRVNAIARDKLTVGVVTVTHTVTIIYLNFLVVGHLIILAFFFLYFLHHTL